MPEIEITLLLLIALLLLANLTVTALGNERIRNAVKAATAIQADLGLARLRLRREELAREIGVGPDRVVPLLHQAALDATGQAAGIDQVIRVEAAPPRIVALGGNLARYVFAPGGAGGRQRKLPRSVRRFPVDALHGDTFVVEELEAAYRALVADRGPEAQALPRVNRWDLWIIPQGLDVNL